MYLGIGAVWVAALAWFAPRLWSLMALADSPVEAIALGFFVLFVPLAWLYGLYNVGMFVAAAVYRRRRVPGEADPVPAHELPPVALLYTTYNDFVEASALSCLGQDYEAFHLYLLDDSTEKRDRDRVDAFAARHPENVSVVRRPDREGVMAGNLNHALSGVALEPVFALVDADEFLPPDFLSRTVPRLVADPGCGFVQANHESNPDTQGALPLAMGIGIDIHWRWYQPLRNDYGFVMLLGHGAVVRREAWESVGGFPPLVSEDLAFALRLREQGWRGYFAEDVVCYEDFPDSVRAFRVRHMKWTRGTTEFLHRETGRLLRARKVSWTEKLDILFPTLGLPLSLFWFLYLLDANLVLGMMFGARQDLTLELGGMAFTLPTWGLNEGFSSLHTADFLVITLLTFSAPVLIFLADLWRQPGDLARFLSKSTVLYASLGPISFVGVASYLFSGRATFLVTGDRGARPTSRSLREGVRRFLTNPHPDLHLLQFFEVAIGLTFAVGSVVFFQPSTFGLALAFLAMPVLHHLNWDHPAARRLIHVPFTLIVAGMLMGVAGAIGLQTIFFGYGFHF